MKLVVVSLLLVLAGSTVSTAGATYFCMGDAPYLPGAISQFYDMWNNIWRYYTCGYVVQKILEDDGGAVNELLKGFAVHGVLP